MSVRAPWLFPSICTSRGFWLMYFRSPRSLKICAIYWPCFVQLASAIYSDSQLKVATERCFLLNYIIGLPQNIITLPEILFQSILSLAQSILEYTTKCLYTPPSLQRILVLIIDLRYLNNNFSTYPWYLARSLINQLSFLRINAISSRVKIIVYMRLLIAYQYSVILIRLS